jgi:hypothetical protein
MEEKSEVIVICGPMTSITPCTKILKCTRCGADCTCSSVGQKEIAKGGKPVCMKCGFDAMKGDQKPEILDPTEAIKLAIETLNAERKN